MVAPAAGALRPARCFCCRSCFSCGAAGFRPNCAIAYGHLRRRRAARRGGLVDGVVRSLGHIDQRVAISAGLPSHLGVHDLCSGAVDIAASLAAPGRHCIAARSQSGRSRLRGWCWCRFISAHWWPGCNAGVGYNTWPLIDGAFVPTSERLWFETPLWRNLFENTLTVQFDHRMLAYAIWLADVAHAWSMRWRACCGSARAAGCIWCLLYW